MYIGRKRYCTAKDCEEKFIPEEITFHIFSELQLMLTTVQFCIAEQILII
ncbi:unnamed protein product [Lepidochelys kempii]